MIPFVSNQLLSLIGAHLLLIPRFFSVFFFAGKFQKNFYEVNNRKKKKCKKAKKEVSWGT